MRQARWVVGALSLGLAGCPSDPMMPPVDSGMTGDTGGADTGGVDTGMGGDTGTPQDSGGGDVRDTGMAGDTTVTPDVPGDGGMSAIPAMVSSLVSSGFSRPVDAVPTASGATVFLLAYGNVDGVPVPTVLRRGMAGAPSVVVQGDPLAAPTGLAISNDDMRLYIADPAGTRAMDVPDDGAIYSVSTEGGMVSVVNTGGSIHNPVAVALHGDGTELTILARDDMGVFGVFRVGTAGGTPRRLDTGGGLQSPSGLAVANDGTVYVLDTRGGGEASGTLLRVPSMGGAPMVLVSGGLIMSFPAGLALSRDGTRLLVSGFDPGNGPGVLTWVRTDGTAPDSPMPFAPMMGLLATPSGLHRARLADVYAIADEGSGDTGSVLLARP
ncbi:MAG: hypothetical protein HY909_14085 [Deltaproteobacteria bacterium]|nr:hypothetical protein [Deltaproteobacteria bacterium]